MKRVISVSLASLIISACSGEANLAGVAYEGNREAMAISSSTSNDTIRETFSGLGGASTSSSAGADGSDAVSKKAITLKAHSRFKAKVLGNVLMKAVAQETVGSCGGTQVISGDIDTAGADPNEHVFSLTMTFNNFCGSFGSTNETVNGIIESTGSFNNGENINITMNMTFRDFTIKGSSYYYEMDGRATLISEPTSYDILYDMTVTDRIESYQYYLEGVAINMSTGNDSNGNYLDETLSGRIYRSDVGYLDISTIEVMRLYSSDIYPSSGSYQFTAANNSSITLIALDNTNYRLDIDTDGDATIDDQQTNTWSVLNIDTFFGN